MTTTTPFSDLTHAIEERFRARITAGGDGGDAITTVFSGDPNDGPSSGLWCRITIASAGRTQQDIGASSIRSRTTGAVIVECYGPAITGTSTLLALADRVGKCFERYVGSGLTFRTPEIPGGTTPTRFGSWSRINVSCPFVFDDLS